MAGTRQGAELTERHRQGQVELANSLVARLIKLFFGVYDFTDFIGSARRFSVAAAPIMVETRRASVELSREYVEKFRAVELPDAPIDPNATVFIDHYGIDEAMEELEELAKAAMFEAANSEYWRGKRKGNATRKPRKAEDFTDAQADRIRKSIEKKLSNKLRTASGEGGRTMLQHEIDNGGWAIGWARVCDADPCALCAVLATVGANGERFFNLDSFKDSNRRFKGAGRFKIHDGCECTMEPIYRVDGNIRMPGAGERYVQAYFEIQAMYHKEHGDEFSSFNAFRRWWESGTLPDNSKEDPGRFQLAGSTNRGSQKIDRSTWDRATYERKIAGLEAYAENYRKEAAAARARGGNKNTREVYMNENIVQNLVSKIAVLREEMSKIKDM